MEVKILTVNVSLTQFLTYSAKVSTSAKVNEINRIKYAPDYNPAVDYWKPLRDEIKRIHENNLPITNLENVLNRVSEQKLKNYSRVISKYTSFIKSHNVEYFQTGSSFWKLNDDLFVRTSPELGLIIDGRKFYVKNWYKKPEKNSTVTAQKIKSTLTMMQISERDFQLEDGNFAVLNLQNGKLLEAPPLLTESVMELEVDAATFIDIWNRL